MPTTIYALKKSDNNKEKTLKNKA